MNRIKQTCALLLAIVLILGVALQPGIGGVFAENTEKTEKTEQTEQITDLAAEPAAEPTKETTPESAEADTLPNKEPSKEQNKHIDDICPECGEADGHAETCSKYTAKKTSYLWSKLTDTDFAAWLMDEANADAVKTILTGDGEEYDDLNSRIGAILDGEDVKLAQQVQEYLAALLGMDEPEVLDGDSGYIYFDLAAGNVKIEKTTYSGYVFVKGVKTLVTGEHKPDNKYYVYQSNGTNNKDTGYETDEDFEKKTNCRLPKYKRVETSAGGGEKWTDYVTNNTDVKAVSNSWKDAAEKSGRTSTGNNITFAKESSYTADMTIDNIWSSFQKPGATRSEGGITAHLLDQRNTTIQLRLKGDNRVGNIHYGANKGTNNQIIFSNGEDANQTPGSITVADFPTNFKGNHWCSAIGGDDNFCDRSDGIVINSGVIYAGTTPEDNCTAIGGGGNQYGRVTINGGTVTAVVSSTGTAIGGGIGYGDAGGDTDVTINDGTIYAYNLGIVYGQGDKFNDYIPAAAIGGGGSRDKDGNKNTNITIKGGTVYAQSKGGAAIGGGCSAAKSGGPATIDISGGTIIAKSTSGTYKTTDDIDAGASIGGGTGLTAGGSVALNISGGTLRTGSIGGGLATQEGARVGSANVEITGGDITGQVIMAGGGSKACTFDMSGGSIHDTDLINGNEIKDLEDPQPGIPIKYIKENGGAVFMNDEEGVTTITGGTIKNCKAENGGAIYMNGGTANIKGGTISGNTATNDGGGVYLPGGDFTLNGGSISKNSAQNGGGIFLSKAPVLNQGTIEANTAKENGGGMYISDCVVELKPAGDVAITGNSAENGAGIYIHDSGPDSGSSKSTNSGVDAMSSATPTKRVGLLVDATFEGNLSFTKNKAGNSGGAVCVDEGHFYLYSDKTTITSNTAKNGGGVAVLEGNFTMTAGDIGRENEANTAESGGGVYVSGGDIWFKGGSINHNTAKNGGGAYVAGNCNMISGNVVSNAAEENGGGIYVNDGTVTMYGGNVSSNTAEESGGGMHISSTAKDKEALVDIFSGLISGNKSKSGGGVSVVSPNRVDVAVGVNCEHPNLKDGNYDSFEYPEVVGDCGKAHDSHNNHIDNIDGKKLAHSSCPQVKDNTATENGGGFFLDSSDSAITIYCLQAEGNKAENDPDSQCMDVRGGHLKIGDDDFDVHLDNKPDQGSAKGNTTMQGSIMVKGGQVDIYGEMENPKFIQDVKVDVTKKEDHYLDHRIIESGHQDYKVHYYENFKNDDGTITGLYIARQYPDEKHADLSEDEKYKFTVMSSIFSRPGYKIVGWNTKPDDTGKKYEVNETYDLSKLKKEDGLGVELSDADGHEIHDDYLLVLYAIWERSGYVLKFDPNVGEGETYTGTMENQEVTMNLLDGSQKINKNEFKRSGYQFKGWTLTPSPADDDKVYEDEETITKDFTDEDGATVTLYAKWELCTHEHSLTYTADGNVLTESCSACGGHTATATVSAVNAVYDGNTHLATVNFSSNWLGNKPGIAYEMEEDATWDSQDEIDDDWKNASDRQPLHAGDYTANLTVGDVTAKTEYTISPVKWETPEVPVITFKVQKDTNTGDYSSIISITEPIGDNVMYQIKQVDTNGNEINVKDYADWQKGKEFVDIPFGIYYYFYAKVCADRDHLESTPSKSTAYLTTGGNVVYIENGTGIKVEPTYGTGDFKYTVSAEEGYHLRGYKDNLPNDSMSIGPANIATFDFIKPIPGVEGSDAYIQEGGITIDRSGPTNGTYEYKIKLENGKVAYHQITLKFSGAAKDASVASKVTDGQVFSDFNSKETSISRDSAFTAQFTVSDYIPEEYTSQALSFSQELPKDTTVIMKTEGKYWYYKLDTAENSIDLTKFTAMGGTEKFSFDKDGTSVKEFTYQFIVDFSAAEENTITDPLKVNLALTANSSHSAPTIPVTGETHISLGIKDKAVFELDSENVDKKSATLNCTYNPSEGAASIWNGRNTALVLQAPEAVPTDLTLTAVIDGKTARYTMNASRQFIIPLGEVGTKEVKLTWDSNLFSSSENNLSFTADWYVSRSSADQSPLNGDKVASTGVTFSCKKDAVPSVRIDGEDHLCKVGGKLKVTINYAGIPSDGTVIAHLQRENGGKYEYTGANHTIEHNSGKNQDVEFSMGQMGKGNYRILVIVQEKKANILQVPYYFVIP